MFVGSTHKHDKQDCLCGGGRYKHRQTVVMYVCVCVCMFKIEMSQATPACRDSWLKILFSQKLSNRPPTQIKEEAEIRKVVGSKKKEIGKQMIATRKWETRKKWRQFGLLDSKCCVKQTLQQEFVTKISSTSTLLVRKVCVCVCTQ